MKRTQLLASCASHSDDLANFPLLPQAQWRSRASCRFFTSPLVWISLPLMIVAVELKSRPADSAFTCNQTPRGVVRQKALNDIFNRATASVPASNESSVLLQHGSRRPDGVSKDLLANTMLLVWDATVNSALAWSYVDLAAQWAELAANRKVQKYPDLSNSYCFVILAFKNLGAMNTTARDGGSLRFCSKVFPSVAFYSMTLCIPNWASSPFYAFSLRSDNLQMLWSNLIIPKQLTGFLGGL